MTAIAQDRDTALAAQLAEQFRRFLPAECVLVDEEELRPYECDGLTAYRRLPLLAVLPQRVDQVQEIMRICAAQMVPVE